MANTYGALALISLTFNSTWTGCNTIQRRPGTLPKLDEPKRALCSMCRILPACCAASSKSTQLCSLGGTRLVCICRSDGSGQHQVVWRHPTQDYMHRSSHPSDCGLCMRRSAKLCGATAKLGGAVLHSAVRTRQLLEMGSSCKPESLEVSHVSMCERRLQKINISRARCASCNTTSKVYSCTEQCRLSCVDCRTTYYVVHTTCYCTFLFYIQGHL